MHLVRWFAAVSVVAVVGTGCGSADGVVGGDEGVRALGSELLGVAADPTEAGPLGFAQSEYRFPEAIDEDVLEGAPIEMWAAVYRPDPMPATRAPVIVMLHGNHATCGKGAFPRVDNSLAYTTTGECPPGYEVVPNHLGYGYLAERLASWGYVVVSVNANRSITGGSGDRMDQALVLARGRLVLRHLQWLTEWDAEAGKTPSSVGTDFAGKLDFSRVGLFGHSRGGEGVRAAYNLYVDGGSKWQTSLRSPVTFKGVYEVAPIDRGSHRVLNANGVRWSVLLPMCDGDVIGHDGIRPLDRMIRSLPGEGAPFQQKSAFAVLGTNHNFFNSEWQKNESRGCRSHEALFESTEWESEKQRTTGLFAVMAFFRSAFESETQESLSQLFDPEYALPPSFADITHAERVFVPASGRREILHKFQGDDALKKLTCKGLKCSVLMIPDHDNLMRAGGAVWTASGPDVSIEFGWQDRESVDATGLTTLEFRSSRQNEPWNSDPETDYAIQLRGADGTYSEPLRLKDYLTLKGPFGHVVLESVRIRLSDFKGIDLTDVRGMKLTFDTHEKGAIWYTDILMTDDDRPAPIPAPRRGGNVFAATTDAPAVEVTEVGNDVLAVRPSVSSRAGFKAAPVPEFELELRSEDGFPVSDALLVLDVGGVRSALVRFDETEPGLQRVHFRLSAEEWASMQDGADVTVQLGEENPSRVWKFGALKKSDLTK